MFDLKNLFAKDSKNGTLSKEEVAKILNTDVESLKKFEKMYQKQVLNVETPDDIFSVNSRQASGMLQKNMDEDESLNSLINRIVDELLSQTNLFFSDGHSIYCAEPILEKEIENPVTLEEIRKIDSELQPQLTGFYMKKDIAVDSYPAVLMQYKMSKKGLTKSIRQTSYHMFRQGLDILDLDPILYEIIGMNPNSIGNWFPKLADGVMRSKKFFKIPATSFIKVPLSLLQLTRQPYESLTPTTIKILDKFCMKAFPLNPKKDYFIKTGTYSSKFDFRNAYVHGEKEVEELGEYLLYIHYQALQMASPLCHPCIYGVSTTNEWVVREFIHDKEDNPCIYKGMPLHTEYRLFVDFDTNKIIGISPYWEPDTMKKRFGHMDDADSPHQKHDYIIYLAHEERLMGRYHDNKNLVMEKMEELLPSIDLHGQWSIDVMQNSDDFYIIDMATAETSALVECVPENLLNHVEENWIPEINI